MKLDRYAVGALAGSAALLVGGGTALASPSEGRNGERCEKLVAKIAERRGVSVEQLQADVKAKLFAAIDAAEKAGRITSELAAQKRQRASEASLCPGGLVRKAKFRARGMIRAAAEFLDLQGSLREQLPGNSLAGLAEKQGKSVVELKAAMTAPGEARIARALAKGKITQAQADSALAKLEAIADRLASRTFPTR